MKRSLLLPLLSLLLLSQAHAQSAKPDTELYQTIARLDTELFDSFNHCEADKFASFFTDDYEFEHDLGGLMTGHKDLVASLKNNICGKVTRELVPGSLKVYPMKDGALEIGVHRFHHPGHEDTEPVGEGQFVHMWVKKGSVWKLSRVYSFDHHALPK
jgi:hypothetical protein